MTTPVKITIGKTEYEFHITTVIYALIVTAAFFITLGMDRANLATKSYVDKTVQDSQTMILKQMQINQERTMQEFQDLTRLIKKEK